MFEPTAITWILVAVGALIWLPVLYAQTLMVLNPRGQKAKDLLIGKAEDWRDHSHFRSSYGFAWADLMLMVPLLVLGILGLFLHSPWGFLLMGAAAVVSLYANIILWFSERQYVYPAQGPLAYYTYYWGFYIYWGTAMIIYICLRMAGINF